MKNGHSHNAFVKEIKPNYWLGILYDVPSAITYGKTRVEVEKNLIEVCMALSEMENSISVDDWKERVQKLIIELRYSK